MKISKRVIKNNAAWERFGRQCIPGIKSEKYFERTTGKEGVEFVMVVFAPSLEGEKEDSLEGIETFDSPLATQLGKALYEKE